MTHDATTEREERADASRRSLWEMARVFLLGMAVAFLAVIAFRPDAGLAWAQSAGGLTGSSAANNIIVSSFPGPEQNMSSVVVIDTERRIMAYYTGRSAQELRLRSARYIGNDLRIHYAEKGNGITVDEAARFANESGGSRR